MECIKSYINELDLMAFILYYVSNREIYTMLQTDINELAVQHSKDIEEFKALQERRKKLESTISKLTTQKAVMDSNINTLQKSICEDLGLPFDSNFSIDDVVSILQKRVSEESDKISKYKEYLDGVQSKVDEACSVLGI